MESIDLTQIITQFYWPGIVLLCVIIFRGPISTLLKERKIKLTLPNNASVSVSSEDAGKTLSNLFTEFYVNYNVLLRSEHKRYFQKILQAETKLTVNDVIEGFDRGNKDHIGALRSIRGLGLIEPKGGGSWKAESVIEVTNFGKVFVEYLKLKDKNA